MELLAPPSIQAIARRIRRAPDDAGASLLGARILVLCSGGADSVAAVALVARLARGAAPASIDVLWLDHGYRADTAAEQTAARHVAEAHGAAFHTRTQTAHEPRRAGSGRQADARSWRYATALEVARELACDTVVTGHTADDAVEGALLDLIGISGTSSARPLPARRELATGVELVRPLLAITRTDVEAVCRELELAWADDPTNDDPDAYARNAVRHRVVPPLLELAPAAGAAIARSVRISGDDVTCRSALAGALLDAWGVGAGGIDVRRLEPLPPAARRAVIAAWLGRMNLGRALDERLVTTVLELDRGRVDLSGGACVRRDGYHLSHHPVPPPLGVPQ